MQTLPWYCLIIPSKPSQFQRFQMHSLLPLPPATRHVNVNIRLSSFRHSSFHLLLPNQKLALHTNVKQTKLLKTHNNSLIANTTPSKLISPNTMHCNGILPLTPPLPPTSQSLLKPHQNTDYSGLVCWRCDSGITVEFVPAGGAPVHYSGCAVNADFS